MVGLSCWRESPSKRRAHRVNVEEFESGGGGTAIMVEHTFILCIDRKHGAASKRSRSSRRIIMVEPVKFVSEVNRACQQRHHDSECHSTSSSER